MIFKQKKGSALVFVLIIIAGIVTVTVGAQRLSLVQFNQAIREEDNQFAYYAAKSGIEDGLLRFRYQRNVETSSGKVFRLNFNTGQGGEIIESPIADTTDYNPLHQYYDIAISYKTNLIGKFSDMSASPMLAQDDEIQLTGFPTTARYDDPYKLRYKFRFVNADNSPCTDSKAFVQIQVGLEDNGASRFEQYQAKMPASGNEIDSNASGSNIEIKTNSRHTGYVRIRPYYCSVRYAFRTTSASGDGPNFDSLTTKITATGYYGQAKRTLQAEVDRKSGVLIGIYDFNLYSGQGSISPN